MGRRRPGCVCHARRWVWDYFFCLFCSHATSIFSLKFRCISVLLCKSCLLPLRVLLRRDTSAPLGGWRYTPTACAHGGTTAWKAVRSPRPVFLGRSTTGWAQSLLKSAGRVLKVRVSASAPLNKTVWEEKSVQLLHAYRKLKGPRGLASRPAVAAIS